MVDNSKQVRKQIFDVISGIAAVVTILVYLVLCINATWQFIPAGSLVYNILQVIKAWAPLIVVALVGIEAFADKHIALRIILYVIIAAVVIFMFFPNVWNNFVGLI